MVCICECTVAYILGVCVGGGMGGDGGVCVWGGGGLCVGGEGVCMNACMCCVCR